MALERELAAYQAHLADLKKNEGKFVLIGKAGMAPVSPLFGSF